MSSCWSAITTRPQIVATWQPATCGLFIFYWLIGPQSSTGDPIYMATVRVSILPPLQIWQSQCQVLAHPYHETNQHPTKCHANNLISLHKEKSPKRCMSIIPPLSYIHLSTPSKPVYHLKSPHFFQTDEAETFPLPWLTRPEFLCSRLTRPNTF